MNTVKDDVLLKTIDAQIWAREFMRSFGHRKEEIDEGLMLAWFANAIMRGIDEQRWRMEKTYSAEIAKLEAENARLREALEHIAGHNGKIRPCCTDAFLKDQLDNHDVAIAREALEDKTPSPSCAR